MDLFNPEIIAYNLIGINKGKYPNIDIMVSAICMWYEMVNKTTSFHDEILQIAKELVNDKKFISMINKVFLSSDEPLERLKTVGEIIDDRCMEPIILELSKIITDAFNSSGGIMGVYSVAHKRIRELSATSLLNELNEVFDNEIYDIFNLNVWEEYFGISIEDMCKRFNPKNILLWYFEEILKSNLAR